MAAATASDFVALECVASAAVTAKRLRTRGPTPSDANQDVAREMAADAEPWPEATQLPTGGPQADSVTHAAAVLAETACGE